MTEHTLVRLCMAPTALFLLALGTLIAVRFLTGTISLRGVLIDRVTGKPSAAQLQLLVTALVGAFSYAISIAHTQSFRALPHVDGKLLTLVGASNFFLLSKEGIRQLVHFIRVAR